jgi:hypothetical protein
VIAHGLPAAIAADEEHETVAPLAVTGTEQRAIGASSWVSRADSETVPVMFPSEVEPGEFTVTEAW